MIESRMHKSYFFPGVPRKVYALVASKKTRKTSAAQPMLLLLASAFTPDKLFPM